MIAMVVRTAAARWPRKAPQADGSGKSSLRAGVYRRENKQDGESTACGEGGLCGQVAVVLAVVVVVAVVKPQKVVSVVVVQVVASLWYLLSCSW